MFIGERSIYKICNGSDGEKAKLTKQERGGYGSHNIYQQAESNLMLCVGLKRRFSEPEKERKKAQSPIGQKSVSREMDCNTFREFQRTAKIAVSPLHLPRRTRQVLLHGEVQINTEHSIYHIHLSFIQASIWSSWRWFCQVIFKTKILRSSSEGSCAAKEEFLHTLPLSGEELQAQTRVAAALPATHFAHLAVNQAVPEIQTEILQATALINQPGIVRVLD